MFLFIAGTSIVVPISYVIFGPFSSPNHILMFFQLVTTVPVIGCHVSNVFAYHTAVTSVYLLLVHMYMMQVACMLLWKYSDFPGLDNHEPTMDTEQRSQ